jgi:hypothetical protein
MMSSVRHGGGDPEKKQAPFPPNPARATDAAHVVRQFLQGGMTGWQDDRMTE